MRTLSKKYKAENYDRVDRERSRLAMVFQYMGRGEVAWLAETPWMKDGIKYHLGVCGETAADGGFLIVRFRCRETGQKDSFDCERLDDGIRRIREHMMYCPSEESRQLRDAVDRLASQVADRQAEAWQPTQERYPLAIQAA